MKNANIKGLDVVNTCLYSMRKLFKMQGKRKGFTLIELLVVVLIIGILAAVALPKYKRAVVRARIASIKPILTSLKNAEEAYYMANGLYTDNFEELDISIPCTIREHDVSLANCGTDWMLDLLTVPKAEQTKDSALVLAYYCPDQLSGCVVNRTLYFQYWLENSTRPNVLKCASETDFGKEICKIENQ